MLRTCYLNYNNELGVKTVPLHELREGHRNAELLKSLKAFQKFTDAIGSITFTPS